MILFNAALIWPLGAALAAFQFHDGCFEPQYVLEAVAGPVRVNCESRYSVTLNGTCPGPTLVLKEERTTWIRVYNRLPDQNITLHWHGLSQRTAPFSDGTPLVSQWPIPPNHFFDYEIRPEIGDAGTYFYHSHVGFQMSTAHGALIVQDAKEPQYDYDDEIVMTLADFYRQTDDVVEKGLLANPFEWSGEPQAVTVQGHSGTSGFDNATDPTCAPHVIMVEPGVQDHPALDVMEADGSYTAPVAVDYMQVAPGQRFSFILKTKSAADVKRAGKSHFWIRYESRDRPASIGGYAVLLYRTPAQPTPEPFQISPPQAPPVKLPQSTRDYLEYALQPKSLDARAKFPRLAEVTRTVFIQVNQEIPSGQYVGSKPNGSLQWVQNGHAWKEGQQAATSRMPYLIQAYKSGNAPNHTLALEHNGFDPVSRTFPANVGEVLDIIWQNNDGVSGEFDFHPMHIHGKHAWDLGSGNGSYDAQENEKRFEDHTPALRDTTVLYRYTTNGAPNTTAGWRAWRIRVTEESVGAWMMHCHIAQHAVMGMNTVWVFGNVSSILQRFPVVPYTQGYLEFGGDAYGNSTRDPFVNHYFEDSGAAARSGCGFGRPYPTMATAGSASASGSFLASFGGVLMALVHQLAL